MGYVLILGANSDLGKVLAEKYAFEGYNLYLADTDVEEMQETREYLNDLCEVKISVQKFNILEFYTHRNFYKSLNPAPVGIIVAINYLGDQHRAQKDFLESKKIIDTNYTGSISILNIVAKDFEEKKSGFITAVGSIVGNIYNHDLYTYFGAKQGFTAHLEGLQSRLRKSGVQVLIAHPGFVYTRETKGLEPPKHFVAVPGDVADAIFNAQQKDKETIEPKKSFRQKIASVFAGSNKG